MIKCLLFFSTYHPAPVLSLLDTKIKETFELWNLTPEQKGLLYETITRMILTSHWSTCKTRIMFEKAKILAMNGESVLFVLFYSQISETEFDSFGKYSPILLYSSLLNEIELVKDENIKKNLKLVVTDNLKQDVLSVVEKQDNKLNIFIDEYSVNSMQDTKVIDDLSNIVDQSRYFWVTLGRVSYQVNTLLQEWLEEKSKSGCLIPNLRQALRNSTEIISFAKTLEPEHKTKSENESELKDIKEFVSTISSQDKEEILKALASTSLSVNEIPKCGLPDKNWPKSDLLTSTNKSFGFKVPDPIISASLETLPVDVKICFEELKSPGRVLVVVLSKEIPEKLIKIIRKARSKKPLMVDENGE